MADVNKKQDPAERAWKRAPISPITKEKIFQEMAQATRGDISLTLRIFRGVRDTLSVRQGDQKDGDNIKKLEKYLDMAEYLLHKGSIDENDARAIGLEARNALFPNSEAEKIESIKTIESILKISQ